MCSQTGRIQLKPGLQKEIEHVRWTHDELRMGYPWIPASSVVSVSTKYPKAIDPRPDPCHADLTIHLLFDVLRHRNSVAFKLHNPFDQQHVASPNRLPQQIVLLPWHESCFVQNARFLESKNHWFPHVKMRNIMKYHLDILG